MSTHTVVTTQQGRAGASPLSLYLPNRLQGDLGPLSRHPTPQMCSTHCHFHQPQALSQHPLLSPRGPVPLIQNQRTQLYPGNTRGRLCGHMMTPLPEGRTPADSASPLSSSAGHGLSAWLTSSHPGTWSPAQGEGERNDAQTHAGVPVLPSAGRVVWNKFLALSVATHLKIGDTTFQWIVRINDRGRYMLNPMPTPGNS